MCERNSLPDLRIKHVKFSGKDIPWNLNIFLYRGGSAQRSDSVQRALQDGKFGKPRLERLEVTVKLHELLEGAAASGIPRDTILNRIISLRNFFAYVDSRDLKLTEETLEDCYLSWTSFLANRVRTNNKIKKNGKTIIGKIKHSSGHTYSSSVGGLIDAILNRATKILKHSVMRHRSTRPSAIGIQAEKQNLENTFVFGKMLQDICDALTIDAIRYAPLPLEVSLRSGIKIMLCRSRRDTNIPRNSTISFARNTLVNLRIEAEISMFIAQTGMNISQVLTLELRSYFYASHIDGYQVKDFKARRGGAVLFEIFKDYKSHFEHYLQWRSHFFPNSQKLFPFYSEVETSATLRFRAERLRKICHTIGLSFISARLLRNTRVNWLLRESGSTEITAEMAQHSQEVLMAHYHKPSLQRAMTESLGFWTKYDPHPSKATFPAKTEKKMAKPAAGPGQCVGEPQKVAEALSYAPEPDCMKKSGCLWCNAHRDIESFEYVWSLTTFRQLKLIEISKSDLFNLKTDKPESAKLTMQKIDSRLAWFEKSSETWREWVSDARELVLAGEYYPDYASLINLLEGNRAC